MITSYSKLEFIPEKWVKTNDLRWLGMFTHFSKARAAPTINGRAADEGSEGATGEFEEGRLDASKQIESWRSNLARTGLFGCVRRLTVVRAGRSVLLELEFGHLDVHPMWEVS